MIIPSKYQIKLKKIPINFSRSNENSIMNFEAKESNHHSSQRNYKLKDDLRCLKYDFKKFKETPAPQADAPAANPNDH